MKRILSAAALALAFTAPQTYAADYGIPDDIQAGNILHCFNWTFNDIKTELPNIAAAGFGSIQVSPVQGNCATNAEWFYAYMPYDFTFKANGNARASSSRPSARKPQTTTSKSSSTSWPTT